MQTLVSSARAYKISIFTFLPREELQLKATSVYHINPVECCYLRESDELSRPYSSRLHDSSVCSQHTSLLY